MSSGVMCGGPPLALGAPTKGFGMARDSLDSRVSSRRGSKMPSLLQAIIGATISRGFTVGVTFPVPEGWTLTLPVTRLLAVIAYARLDAT